MKHTALALLVALALVLAACTPCNDGTRSWSHGSGTCSHHGGVRR